MDKQFYTEATLTPFTLLIIIHSIQLCEYYQNVYFWHYAIANYFLMDNI